ncbi:MAG: GtrA family protein, partial [Dinoroseobacter sp.]|nr:GtrA family protein [Dinoroseobacter sp.]
EAQTFARYTATGIITTLIFWGSESAFWFIWQTHAMRELGAVIGLTIGYVMKFNLDRLLVFAKPAGRE